MEDFSDICVFFACGKVIYMLSPTPPEHSISINLCFSPGGGGIGAIGTKMRKSFEKKKKRKMFCLKICVQTLILVEN